MHAWLLAGAFILLGVPGIDQRLAAQSIDQWTRWGDASMEQGEYYGASRFYEGALSIDPGRMSLQWKQAEACRLSNQYGKAADLYDRVHRKDMGRTYPDALKWLGEMQLSDGRYADAERTWERVLQKSGHKDPIIAQRARNALLGCAMASDTTFDVEGVEIDHIRPPVNTYDSEFGARIGPDQALYFSSQRGELDANEEVKDTASYRTLLFRSRSEGDQWLEPDQLPTSINGDGDNGNSTWTPDGRWILFTRCAAGSPCRVHMAEVLPDGFGEALPFPGLGDDLTSTQAMVTLFDGHDVPLLFFVSDRPGGAGGMDIWQARIVDGKAVDIHPLPPPVNSPGNERCPWYDHGTRTLWFSSDHHPGLGGYDIFTAVFKDDVFGPVINAGRPLNSPANDLYPSIDPGSGEGWITSNRIGSFAAKGATCCNDLYRFRSSGSLVHLADTVGRKGRALVDTPTGGTALRAISERLPLKLYFHNDDPDPRTTARTTEQDYATTYRRYRALLPEYDREGDAAELNGFFRDEVDRGYLDLAELTIALGETLDQGTSVTLEVRGHASPLALNEYNRYLSERRISSLRNHLLKVDGGALSPYINGNSTNGASLVLKSLPFGEEASAQGVSDQLSDLTNSVYSVAASRERRIEITSIQLHTDAESDRIRTIRKQLGDLQQEEERIVSFILENPGASPMLLLDSKADCGCTTAALKENSIEPGGAIEVDLVFNGHAPIGPLERTVVIRTNGQPELFELVIEGMIVP